MERSTALVPSLGQISKIFEMYEISKLRVSVGNSILIADLGTQPGAELENTRIFSYTYCT
jgi:hypothetical protein